MGRPKVNLEDQIPCRLPAGTKERIKALLEPRETITAFLQVAVMALVNERERLRSRKRRYRFRRIPPLGRIASITKK